ALNDDAVRVLQILLESRRAAASKRCPQTGDGCGVSNTGLVLDLNDAQRAEELLDEVVLLIVERRPTEMSNRHRPAQVLFPKRVAGPFHPLRNHVHRSFERNAFPRSRAGPTVEDMALTIGTRHQLIRRGAFRAETALRDG